MQVEHMRSCQIISLNLFSSSPHKPLLPILCNHDASTKQPGIFRLSMNMEVLLRERKRHTDCGVSSTLSVVLYWGVPLPVGPGWGTPPPPLDLAGVPPWSDLAGVPPASIRPGWGNPPPSGPGRGTPIWTWLGYPLQLDLTGVPPPGQVGYPPCGQTDGWMDRHVSKHNLPSYYVRGR